MPDIHAIRTMFQLGHSKRAIARTLHVSRKTAVVTPYDVVCGFADSTEAVAARQR